jgi:hypothetical protein
MRNAHYALHRHTDGSAAAAAGRGEGRRRNNFAQRDELMNPSIEVGVGGGEGEGGGEKKDEGGRSPSTSGHY